MKKLKPTPLFIHKPFQFFEAKIHGFEFLWSKLRRTLTLSVVHNVGERKAGCGGRWAAYAVMSEKKTALQHAAENARHGKTSQDKTGKEKREGGGAAPYLKKGTSKTYTTKAR